MLCPDAQIIVRVPFCCRALTTVSLLFYLDIIFGHEYLVFVPEHKLQQITPSLRTQCDNVLEYVIKVNRIESE